MFAKQPRNRVTGTGPSSCSGAEFPACCHVNPSLSKTGLGSLGALSAPPPGLHWTLFPRWRQGLACCPFCSGLCSAPSWSLAQAQKQRFLGIPQVISSGREGIWLREVTWLIGSGAGPPLFCCPHILPSLLPVFVGGRARRTAQGEGGTLKGLKGLTVTL